MPRDWEPIYYIMTSLYLTLFPGVSFFRYKTLPNMFAFSNIILSYQICFRIFRYLQRTRTSRGEKSVVTNQRWLDMPWRTMLIFDDRQLWTVEAIVCRILLAFRQKPPLSTVSFYDRKKTKQSILTINSYRKLIVLTLCSNSNFVRVLR